MKITDRTGINASGYSRMQDTNGANQDNRLKSIQKQIENVQGLVFGRKNGEAKRTATATSGSE